MPVIEFVRRLEDLELGVVNEGGEVGAAVTVGLFCDASSVPVLPWSTRKQKAR